VTAARQPLSGGPWMPVDDWVSVVGRQVRVYRNGVQIDCGQVDAVTDGGGILWLMQDGAHPRRIVEKVLGVELHLA